MSKSDQTIPHSEWLTAGEAAQYLKVKVRTLLLWVRQGKVKAFALSGTKRRVWRFRRQDLDAALLESPVLPSIPLSVRSERGIS
jgi:excisionase family DNA binding protein